jgi:DNA-binding transcriptional MerR regulator
MTTFISTAETSRRIGVPASQIHRAIEEGLITPAARAGTAANSPSCFNETDLPEIAQALQMRRRFASARQVTSLSDIRAKFEALSADRSGGIE